jgi:hypothetical protein
VYLCVLCGSRNKQRLFSYTALTDWNKQVSISLNTIIFITELRLCLIEQHVSAQTTSSLLNKFKIHTEEDTIQRRRDGLCGADTILTFPVAVRRQKSALFVKILLAVATYTSYNELP